MMNNVNKSNKIIKTRMIIKKIKFNKQIINIMKIL